MGSDLIYYLGELRPREDWLRIFQALLEENEEEMIVKPLITPKKRKHRYLMETTPSRLASMESWDPLESPDSFKDLSEKLQQVDQRLTNFQLRVGDNVDVLFNRVQEIKASIGSIPVSLLNDECTTVWEMLAIVRSLITDPELFQPVEIKLTDFNSHLNQHSQKIMSLTDTSHELSELLQLLSAEQDHHQEFGRLPSLSKKIAAEFLSLAERVERLETSSSTDNNALLLSLQAEVKLLEAQMPSNPFTIGGKTFNSKADVALFIE